MRSKLCVTLYNIIIGEIEIVADWAHRNNEVLCKTVNAKVIGNDETYLARYILMQNILHEKWQKMWRHNNVTLIRCFDLFMILHNDISFYNIHGDWCTTNRVLLRYSAWFYRIMFRIITKLFYFWKGNHSFRKYIKMIITFYMNEDCSFSYVIAVCLVTFSWRFTHLYMEDSWFAKMFCTVLVFRTQCTASRSSPQDILTLFGTHSMSPLAQFPDFNLPLSEMLKRLSRSTP